MKNIFKTIFDIYFLINRGCASTLETSCCQSHRLTAVSGTALIVQRIREKSCFVAIMKFFCGIPHLWAVLNENQSGARLTHLRIFLTKNRTVRYPQATVSILGNISTFKPLRDMFLVLNYN